MVDLFHGCTTPTQCWKASDPDKHFFVCFESRRSVAVVLSYHEYARCRQATSGISLLGVLYLFIVSMLGSFAVRHSLQCVKYIPDGVIKISGLNAACTKLVTFFKMVSFIQAAGYSGTEDSPSNAIVGDS
jgi:hypothetical protein